MSKEADDIVQIRKENTDLKVKLQHSNVRFHNLVEKGLIGFLVMNREGDIIYLNPAALKLYDCNIGQFLGEESGIPAKEGYIPALKIMSGDKREVIVEVLVSNIEWEGEPAYLAYLNDITMRMLAEKKVIERTAELTEANASLEEKNKELVHYNGLFIDREFRINELREKVKELEGKLG